MGDPRLGLLDTLPAHRLISLGCRRAEPGGVPMAQLKNDTLLRRLSAGLRATTGEAWPLAQPPMPLRRQNPARRMPPYGLLTKRPCGCRA